jgi:hypothetical protein
MRVYHAEIKGKAKEELHDSVDARGKSKSCALRLVRSAVLVFQLHNTNAMSLTCHRSIWAWYRKNHVRFVLYHFGLSSLVRSLVVVFRPYLRKRYKVSVR